MDLNILRIGIKPSNGWSISSGQRWSWPLAFPVQASNIIFSNITSSSADVSYTRGNGSSCLVLITEGTTPYPPLQDNTSYALSSQDGTSDWYCKYNGTANSVCLTGLNLTTYRLMVYEYNGTAGMEKYLTDTAIHNPAIFKTVGINDQVSPKINIYPNPSNGKFAIQTLFIKHLPSLSLQRMFIL